MPTFPFVIQYPLIAGHRFSHRSLEIQFNGLTFLGVKSLNWSESLEPGQIYGTVPQILGETRGKQSAKWDAEIYRLEWELLRKSLGAGGIGYGEQRFPIRVTHFEIGQPVVMDEVVGARITSMELSSSDGDDGAMVKLSGSALRLHLNGTDSIAAPIKVSL